MTTSNKSDSLQPPKGGGFSPTKLIIAGALFGVGMGSLIYLATYNVSNLSKIMGILFLYGLPGSAGLMIHSMTYIIFGVSAFSKIPGET